MKQLGAVVLVTVLFALSACATPIAMPTAAPASAMPEPSAAATEPAETETASKKEIRVGHLTQSNVADLPTILIIDELEKQGYTVTQDFFESQDLAVDALSRGFVDIAYGAANTFWVAVQKGADVRAFMSSYNNPFFIVAIQEIQECSDLDGRRYGIGSASGNNTLLSKEYMRENCPEAEPQFLSIANSQARTAAMLAGELDATTVEIADMQELEKQAPGKFHVLVDFPGAFPRLIHGLAYMKSDFGEKNPELLMDYIRANLKVYGELHENPARLYAAAEKEFNMTPEEARAAVDPYLASNVWKLDNQNLPEALQYTMEFLTRIEVLEPGLNVDDVADLMYVNEVMGEGGK